MLPQIPFAEAYSNFGFELTVSILDALQNMSIRECRWEGRLGRHTEDSTDPFLGMKDLVEYIKVQWADIHHTRNADWKVLIIIIGVFYALFNVDPKTTELQVAIVVVGLIW